MKLRPIPITQEEKQQAIADLMQNFHRQGELLLPDEEFYPESYDENTLEKVSKKVFVWLGLKPRGLKYRLSSREPNAPETILLDPKYTNYPYLAAAITAKQALAHFLHKSGQSFDNELIEIASIEFGLGLLVINASNGDDSLKARIKRVISIGQDNINSSVLSHFSLGEYSRLFNIYVQSHELPPKTVWEHSLPWAKHAGVSHNKIFGLIKYDVFVLNATQTRKTNQAKTAGVIFIISFILVFSGFLWANKPRRLSVELQQQKDTIEVLKSAYQACDQSVKLVQTKQDTNDIFSLQKLDGEITRCNSIKNKHDHEVRDFNAKIRAAGLE